MGYRRTIVLVITTLTFATAMRSQAQVSLYPFVSAETNAMGGAGVAFVSDNALATIANPAELGLFSLHGILNASYMPNIPGQLNAFAVNAGSSLNQFWHELPFKAGLGVGYSNPNYSYPSPTLGYQTLMETDVVNGVTFGLGVDYFVRLGLGYTLKWVSTKGRPTYYNSTYSPDFGAILQIPVTNLILKSSDPPVISTYNVTPVLNITFGYSKRNEADYAPYGYAVLPREGDFGWNFEVGLKTYIRDYWWKWFSFTWVRQADAPLTSWNGQTYVYDSGLGDTQVYDNLIAGRPTGNVSIEKGWQIQLGQFLYLRGGSATGPGVPTYTTFGWGARLDGLVKALIFMHGLDANGNIVKFVLNHLNLQFDYSKSAGEIVGFGNTGGIGFKGEPFEILSLTIR